ncbi:uracil-DNA glycosylase [Granulosicoccus antarcticus]|uniref:Uracil-DNA glycosylase-like domain-containing protein n=1 Tax=Granulosicoccus antarcticus IMCC3135 TaxID=1192854 RepID=A0A2Z2NKE6_9GAMM|nr:uracil-DNA glycosylase [Granulosicoccus antarcticus]ASJ70358.1 hypothetical protein IMCC3135_01195 [Granulosicoccus antarcticus IMCC3135]
MAGTGKIRTWILIAEQQLYYRFFYSKRDSMAQPKILGLKGALEMRLSQVDDNHIAPLSEFVRRLRVKMGPGAAIPFVDPWDGGVEAEVLFLLEAPGSKARSSGFVSMNNPDETARNFFEVTRDSGIDRKHIVIWNRVPWYIGCYSRIRPAKSADIAKGIESLAELIELLPKLRACVLVGGKAQKALDHVKRVAPHLAVFSCPHPSPMFVNRKPENREILLSKCREVQSFLLGQGHVVGIKQA